jgi:hypothetical protein
VLSPGLRNPFYYSFGLLAEKTVPAFVFGLGRLLVVGALVHACPPSEFTGVYFNEETPIRNLVPQKQVIIEHHGF